MATYPSLSSFETFRIGFAGAARTDFAASGDDVLGAESSRRAGREAWRRGETAQAGGHFRQAVALAPDDAASRSALADWCLNTGDLHGAMEHSARAVALAPDAAHARLSRASALGLSGDHAGAYRALAPLLGMRRCPPAAAAILAKLARPLGLEEEALGLLTRLLGSVGVGAEDRSVLHFAAFEVLDRMGRHDEAFAHASSAHRAHRRPYDPRVIGRQVDLQLAYFTPQKVHGLPRATHGSRRPVFVIGMPRSGTTLVEQILSSHPEVYGGGEIGLLGDVVRSYVHSAPQGMQEFPMCLDALSLRTCNELASRYLSGLAGVNSTARYVTDKMLPNFMYLGMIAALFPDAQVIQCTRDPLDTCLSCYTTDFLFGHEFAQDLSHLAHYQRQYDRLMSHWRDTLKLPMIEVSYERVVSDLEGEVRRLLEHLDLAWDPRCVNFHRNPRHVPTASVEQVRQPLYSRSVGRWRKYEKHLGPLIEGLRA